MVYVFELYTSKQELLVVVLFWNTEYMLDNTEHASL